jgi:N-methylhydantoinase A/oxoprolinase/acetone carboxylase beta subunit
MSRRSRIVGFGSAGVLVVAGIASAFAFSGGLGQNLAFALVAFGLVLATSLVFYEVGLTEDKDRAREERAARKLEEEARRRERDQEAAAKREHPPEQSARIRLGRSRGRPRRLR